MPEPEPDEIQFACIGCGTNNPASAEVCTGCGHRFAGPAGGMLGGAIPSPIAPRPPERIEFDRPIRPAQPIPDQPTALGCLLKGIGILLTILATLVAFVIAFFATCSALWNQDSGIVLAFAAGLAAAGTVIAVVFGISRAIRSRKASQD